MIEMYEEICGIFSGEEMLSLQTSEVKLPTTDDFICVYDQIGHQTEAKNKTEHLHERLCLVGTDSVTGQIVILVTQESCLRRNDSHGDSRV